MAETPRNIVRNSAVVSFPVPLTPLPRTARRRPRGGRTFFLLRPAALLTMLLTVLTLRAGIAHAGPAEDGPLLPSVIPPQRDSRTVKTEARSRAEAGVRQFHAAQQRAAARERAAREAREEALRAARAAARASAATSTRRATHASGTEQWRALCERYFPGHADEALYVIRGESGGNPQASNGICRGLFQIHECHAATFLKVTGRSYWDGVYDPDANAHFAAYLSGSGSNWSAWSVRP